MSAATDPSPPDAKAPVNPVAAPPIKAAADSTPTLTKAPGGPAPLGA